MNLVLEISQIVAAAEASGISNGEVIDALEAALRPRLESLAVELQAEAKQLLRDARDSVKIDCEVWAHDHGDRVRAECQYSASVVNTYAVPFAARHCRSTKEAAMDIRDAMQRAVYGEPVQVAAEQAEV